MAVPLAHCRCMGLFVLFEFERTESSVTVFDASLASKEFTPVETVGTVMIGVGFLVIVFADRISLNYIKDVWETISFKLSACWSTTKKIGPQTGTIEITDPDSSQCNLAVISVQTDATAANETAHHKNVRREGN